ncbi:hypothetical protein ACIQTC_26720, partial [Streptomyces sp. NPDC091217]
TSRSVQNGRLHCPGKNRRSAGRVTCDVKRQAQISITMDVYTHVVQDTQREAMSHMDRLLRSRKRRLGRG